jgi:quercetin dioxygenase-like cupin family protein
MEVDFDGKVIVFNAGEGVFIPTGKKHKAKALSNTVKAILVEDV